MSRIVESNYLRVSRLYNQIMEGRYIVPAYQREYCWDNAKIELFIDSISNNIPVGVFQFRKRYRNDTEFEVVDGLHRIRTLFKVLLGKGIYFNFEKGAFTTNPNDFDYSSFVDGHSGLIDLGENGLRKSVIFNRQYTKVIDTELLCFIYSGTDEQIESAFNRINDLGVAITPVFNKVEGETILTI